MRNRLSYALALFVAVTMSVGNGALIALGEDGTANENVAKDVRKKVLVIAGKKSHGPEGNGIHDYPWSARLLKVMLDRSNVKDRIQVDYRLDGWPKDQGIVESADTIVIISDGRDNDKYADAPHLESDARVAFVDQQMRRGCGLVTFHFSTFAPEKYREPLLRWNGGYFQWETEDKRKWYSAMRTVESEVELTKTMHTTLRGIRPFKLKEEFYYNLRFDPRDQGFSPLLMVPALKGREPDGNIVAWAKQRTKADGNGRGFGTTCGHFYDNWKNDDFRRLMLNGITWSAGVDLPEGGVEARYYDRDEIKAALDEFKP